MQVNFNSQNSVRPQFGMAIKATPEGMDNLSKSFKKVADWVEFDRLVTGQANNEVADVLISSDGKKIVAQVGPNKYKQGLHKAIKAIRKAAAKAEELRTRHDAVKLEADADYMTTVKNKVGLLPSEQKLPSVGRHIDDEPVDTILEVDVKMPKSGTQVL